MGVWNAMNLGQAINYLLPFAQYRGAIGDNTKAQYDAIEWVDERKKPSWGDIETTMAIDNRTYDPDKLIVAIDSLGLSDSLEQILASAPARIRLRWQKATVFKGEDPDFQAMIATLQETWHLTDEQVEALLSACVV